jgi:hypothetical protein
MRRLELGDLVIAWKPEIGVVHTLLPVMVTGFPDSIESFTPRGQACQVLDPDGQVHVFDFWPSDFLEVIRHDGQAESGHLEPEK